MGDRYPDFFIVGAAKCGTTSLFEYLGQHPQVFAPVEKEPNYFAADLFPSGYISQSDYLALFRDVGAGQICGEGSVSYLYSKAAAKNIAAVRGDARIIILLRNPVDMMYSLHSEHVFQNWESILDFGEALAAEAERKAGRNVPRNVYQPAFLYYRERARFAEQVRRFISVFGREQVQVLLLEDLKADTKKIYREVLQFLEIDTDFVADFTATNRNKTFRSPLLRRLLAQPDWLLGLGRRLLPFRIRRMLLRGVLSINRREEQRDEMDPGLRERLMQEFRPEVEELESLIRRDLSIWYR